MKGRNKKVFIFLGIMIAIAVVIFLVTGSMAGWDIVGWFKSQPAFWCYAILGMTLVMFLYIIISDRIKKL